MRARLRNPDLFCQTQRGSRYQGAFFIAAGLLSDYACRFNNPYAILKKGFIYPKRSAIKKMG